MSEFKSKLSIVKTDQVSSQGNPKYKLTAPLLYVSSFLKGIEEFDEAFDGGLVTVPAGFITDLASIPWPYNRIFRPDGKWSRAAVIHDYLCKLVRDDMPPLNREQADKVFYEAMRADGVSLLLAWTFWTYVRVYYKIKY